jgi:hypothetical protein
MGISVGAGVSNESVIKSKESRCVGRGVGTFVGRGAGVGWFVSTNMPRLTRPKSFWEVGAIVGVADGLGDGAADGMGVGLEDGIDEGAADGELVGAFDNLWATISAYFSMPRVRAIIKDFSYSSLGT